MLKMRVARDLYSGLSTQGKLTLDYVFECYTLEPPTKTDGTKPRAIDNGTYPLTIRWSNHFQRHMPHVESVPSFVAIEWHVGNVARDTEGCTLMGRVRGPQPDFVGQSLVAITVLMAKLLASAVLTNPSSPEKEHVWQVGEVTYYDARIPLSNTGGR